MSVENKATLSGADYLLKWLGGKPTKAAEKATRRGITRGAKLILAQQKGSAPVRTKLLWKSLGYKIRKYKMVYFAVIGVRRGFRVRVKAIEKKRIIAIAQRTVKTKSGNEVRSRQVKLLAKGRVKVGEFLNPTRYAHLADRFRPFVRRNIKAIQNQVKEEINAGLRGELR